MDLITFEIAKRFMETIKKSPSTTCWHTIDEDSNYTWAIVFGETDDGIAGKVAYCPLNSAMNEYDIDWMMPFDSENGNVDDTEILIGDTDDNINESIRFLNNEARRFADEYIGQYIERRR